MLSYAIFSWVRNDLGFGLSTLGILLLLLLHRVNLRTIEEPPKNTCSSWISDSSLKLTISFMLTTLFLYSIMYSFLSTWNIYVLHLRNVLEILFFFILIPIYIINQNENLKLYVSVYHWVPAPVLPWQLPKNFNPKSVKLIYVNHPNNE